MADGLAGQPWGPGKARSPTRHSPLFCWHQTSLIKPRSVAGGLSQLVLGLERVVLRRPGCIRTRLRPPPVTKPTPRPVRFPERSARVGPCNLVAGSGRTARRDTAPGGPPTLTPVPTAEVQDPTASAGLSLYFKFSNLRNQNQSRGGAPWQRRQERDPSSRAGRPRGRSHQAKAGPGSRWPSLR